MSLQNLMDVKPCLQHLCSYVETTDYAGYDPYDGLNSSSLKVLSCKSKWVRIAFTQTLKKLLVNVRPFLGVKKGHNPKGNGLFLWSYAAIQGRAETVSVHLMET